MKITLKEILTLIKTKAQLSNVESTELEKSFYEIINLKIIQRLGEELNQQQKKDFLEGLKTVKKDQKLENMSNIFKQIGMDLNKAKEYLELAIKQSFEEIIDILGNRLPDQTREEINRPFA